ncbi:hypothetical protein GOODEAATRI_024218, partial [Goodea atripinnis]
VNLTEVSVNQAHLRFVENYGFQFMIENFSFTLNFDSTSCSWLPTAVSITGLSATMEIGLTRNENRLAANMRTCQASIDRIRFVGTSLPRQPQPPPMANGGVEPVFTEDALMAYVGISEFFFNSAARSLYEAGLMEKNFNEQVAPLNVLVNNKATEFLSGLFGNGVEIPVPEGVNFTQGNIRYENVSLSGTLNYFN